VNAGTETTTSHLSYLHGVSIEPLKGLTVCGLFDESTGRFADSDALVVVHQGIRDAVIEADCDNLIPAARLDVIIEGNAGRVRARLIIEGANIPATTGAEDSLHKRGVLEVPDLIANAGGVICASVEYHGGSEPQALAAIEDKIRRNTTEVLTRARSEQSTPRAAANTMALERVRAAQSLRRFG